MSDIGTIKLTSNKSGWRGQIEWSYDQNIAGGYTTVYATVYSWKTDGFETSTGGAFNGTITINSGDGAYSETETFTYIRELPGGTSDEKHSISARIYHDSIGRASVKISCSIDAPSGCTLTGHPLSGSSEEYIFLPAMTINSGIVSAADIEIGELCSVSWTSSPGLYYRLKFALGSWSSTTGVIYPNQSILYTYTSFFIPIACCDQITTSTTGTALVTLYTYSDSQCSNQLGDESSYEFEVSVPSSRKPKILGLSASVDDDIYLEDVLRTGVAGFSKVKLFCTTNSYYGATVDSITITGVYNVVLDTTDSEHDVYYTGGIISTPGTYKFCATCRDSRGMVSDPYYSDEITILPYTAPQVDSFVATKRDDGVVVLTAAWTCDPIENSAGAYNTGTATFYYRESSVSDWVQCGSSSESGEEIVITGLTFSDEISYYFRVVVTDTFSRSAVKEEYLSTAKVLLDFKVGGDGLGIGKVCESAGMEVGMKATFFDDIYIADDTLAEYIRRTMMIANYDMFGVVPAEEAISNPVKGQIYYKKVT